MPKISAATKKAIKKYNERPHMRLYVSSKINSHRCGVEHTLKPLEIKALMPDKCPIFGVPFTYTYGTGKGGRHPYNPSIDRIDPTKGYIEGNVQIISNLANRMKQNATEDELIAFAKGILKYYNKEV